jgi:D-alanyl-D-alanine carboxypeptidase
VRESAGIPAPARTTLDLDPIWASVPSPASSCLVVDGEYERNPDLPVIPASTIKLFVASLAPEDPRVEPMLVDSDNDAARALVAEHGAPSWPGVVAKDATGHDRGNRVTCRALVDVLKAHPGLPLAVAGETGTLRDRMLEVTGRISGKTGSIRGVEALAGRTADGDVFAMVLNDLVDAEEGKRTIGRLAASLVQP